MLIHFILLGFVYITMLITTIKMENWEKKQLLNIDSEKGSNILIVKGKNKTYLIGLFLVFIVLSLFGGLRDVTVGTDTQQYVTSFYNNPTYGFEKGYELIARSIGVLTSDYWIYLVIVQAVILVGIFKSVSKYQFSYALFFLLYITSYSYTYSFTALRFYCALSIILISLEYMIQKKTFKVIIITLIASLFHMSALIFIPVYFATFHKLTIRYVIMLVFATLTTIIMLTVGIDFVFSLNIGFLEKYSYIVTKQSVGIGFSFLINLFVLFIGFNYRPLVTKYRGSLDFFLKLQLIATVFDFFPYAYRLVWFFRFPIWFIIPIILLNIKLNGKSKFDYVFWYSAISFCFIAYYYVVLKGSLPSHNFLDFKFNTSLN